MQLLGITWQPSGDYIHVTFKSDALDMENVDVYHMATADADAELVTENAAVEDNAVTFDASSFSVYVIIRHEGGEVVTPRVEFHFIDRLTDEEYTGTVSSPFTAGPYNFVNTAGEYQTTQILKDGDQLEMINDPRNVKIVSEGKTVEKFFYGWYVVNKTDDTTSRDASTGKYTGSITYTWPDVMKVGYTEAIEITAVDTDSTPGINVGDTVNWTLGEASGTGTIDADGSVHVYLAPLFQDFYFVNFRMGVRNSTLANNLLSRKLVVFGENDSAVVRIGDMVCPSSDPQHQIFVGWETVTGEAGSLERDVYYQTVDLDGNEINNSSSGTGYYVTVTKASSEVTQLDLYPVFAEARWMHFNTGLSGNGATYVASAYRVTHDENVESYFDSDFFKGEGGNVSHMSTRPGYTLEGWYIFAKTDENGNITNLTESQDVTVEYIDETGRERSVTVTTKAIKLVNAGADPTAASYGTFAYTGAYNLYPVGGNSVKLFEVTNDGKMYVYIALDDITLYANWVSGTVDYTVVYWLENANDDDYTLMYYKTLQGVAGQNTAAAEVSETDTFERNGTSYNPYNEYKLRFAHLAEDQDKDKAGVQSGIQQQTIEGDGSTIINVYYDRNVYRLRFDIGFKQGNDYYVSNLTNSYNSNTDRWENFLTQNMVKLGTANPFSASDYTGTYETTVSGRTYTIYYYDIVAKFGETILDKYPGSQTSKRSDNTTYSFVGWIPQPDSFYWEKVMSSIKGFFETMSEDLILTGGTPRQYQNNGGNTNANPDSYNAVSVNDNNTLTHELGITQEFRCRYKSGSGYNYLYRIYLADPETQDYPAEPTHKIIVTAGSGSTPNLQTAPTYQGYTLMDTKVLTSATDTNGVTPSNTTYSYAIPELTAAGVGNGMIMQFKFQPNLHHISYKYGSGAPSSLIGQEFSTASLPYYYGQSIEGANVNQQAAVDAIPTGYSFAGWYENIDGVGNAFVFSSGDPNHPKTMPDGDIVLYAVYKPLRYRITIDPNGGEIDHIDHTIPSTTYASAIPAYIEGPFNRGVLYYKDPITGVVDTSKIEREADIGYRKDQSTYFNGTFGELVGEYTLRARNYVPLSDAAAQTYKGNIYYYVKTLPRGTDGSSLPSDLRNALYMTEDELHAYYLFYRGWTQGNLDGGYITGTTVLDEDTWRQVYVSTQKYRIIGDNEHWTFLGWFKVKDGVTENMPYNFSTPVSEPFTLKAMWRLDGNYRVQYIAEYPMPDGKIANGGMEAWTDPNDTSGLAYSDGAATTVYKAPTELTLDGLTVTDDSVIFRGFRLVMNTGTDVNPVYTPIEAEGTYYYPGDDYVIQAANADPKNGTIYLQAVYHYKDSSDRRPVITNLILDANTGYVNKRDSGVLPVWVYPGRQAINTLDHLLPVDGESWPTQILFGDIQSSAAVHLYKYATELTEDAAHNLLTDSHQFFTHPDSHFLLGFDDGPTEGDYIATYPADSVIAVERNDHQTIYAVWEPMVYVTFKNETQGTVTFGLSSTDGSALQVINVKKGMYDRVPLADFNEITLTAQGTDDDTITLAFPYGAEKSLTVSGTNTLGVGKVLMWNSSIELVNGSTTTQYTTVGSTTPDVSYTHGDHSHTLVSGEVFNTKDFNFTENMIVNENPLTVTFTSRNNEYALLLDDNYTGGGVQEIDYGLADIKPEDGAAKTQKLPTTSTRIGYSFIGWAYDRDATTPDFSASSPASNPWTILDLNNENGGFFSTDITNIDGVMTRTLYAVWEAKTDAVYVYKDVPAPGNQNQEFTFTLAITGSYKYSNNYGGTEAINKSGTFKLKHGEYAKISSSKVIPSTNGSYMMAYVQSVIEVYHPVVNSENGTTSYELINTVLVKWERSVLNDNNSNSFVTLQIAVTETPVTHYDTTVTLNALQNDSDLKIGSAYYTKAQLPQTVDTNTISWANTDAGGSVVFTNQRQTYDVSVSKDLTSNTTAATAFSFTASYNDNGNIVTLDPFTVFSGNKNEDALKGIPAGATLTITEKTDTGDNYATQYTLDDRATFTDGKTATFVVTKNTDVIFDNTLKSYPVTFKLVDQDENTTINGMFSLASSVGLLSGTSGTELYASATSTNPPAGVFYTSNMFWADTYTLTQTITPTGYIGLSGPVTLTVTGNGIVSNNPWVTVTGDATNGYIITVKNWAQKTVTVKKVLNDPLLSSTRSFTFNYSYTSPLDTSTVNGTFNLVPSANDASGISQNLIIPVNAVNLVITEQEVPAEYKTTVAKDSDAAQVGFSYTIGTVSDNATITFTNTRKEIKITLVKQVDGSGGTFSFEATVKNGVNVLTNYGTTESPVNGFVAGKQTIDLTVPANDSASAIFSIPYGTVLDLIELPVEGYYDTTVEGKKDSDSSRVASGTLSITLTAAKTVEDLTVTFTNTEVIVAPTGVAEETGSSWWMLAVGLALVPGAAVPFVLKKRKENEDRA